MKKKRVKAKPSSENLHSEVVTTFFECIFSVMPLPGLYLSSMGLITITNPYSITLFRYLQGVFCKVIITFLFFFTENFSKPTTKPKKDLQGGTDAGLSFLNKFWYTATASLPKLDNSLSA